MFTRFSNKKPVAVKIPLTNDERQTIDHVVRLSEVKEFHAQHGGWVDMVGFEQEDGSIFWCYGKSWVDSKTGAIVRIGAGAAGDLIVWNA